MINYFKGFLEVKGLEISITPDLRHKVPGFKAGIIEYENIVVGDSPQMLKGRLQLFQESIFFELENKNVTEFDGIKEWRQVFKQAGKDPNRYRHSAEALFRRIKKQNYLSTVNSAADLNNFFSLEYQSPIGIYDKSHLEGPIRFRLGLEGEEYMGLNGRPNSLENLIITEDLNGPFGSPFVDSSCAPVTEDTTEAVQVIYFRPSLDKDNCARLAESLMGMFLQVHGGEGRFSIIE
jgi:DNA/RNA-binding domain of Phe-tRNA-synthetase-like protein